jgi:putative hydrolase of the HAD superfamily
MVGNSPRSDINPAVEAGLGAILIPHDHTWKAEIQEIARPELVVTLARFADLLPYFGIEADW